MEKYFLLVLMGFMAFSEVNGQQKSNSSNDLTSGVQDISRIAPQMLPRSIRDSIEIHITDREAEITIVNEMSKDGKLIYEVNFLKDENTWSKIYNDQGHLIKNEKKID